MFWQLTFAIRNTMLFGFAVAILSRAISIGIGLWSGYKGGLVDRVLPDAELWTATTEIARTISGNAPLAVKAAKITIAQVLKDAETNEVLGKMKVSALLEALPKVGKVKAQEIMTELEIAPTRRLRGLGDRQRKALLEKFDFS